MLRKIDEKKKVCHYFINYIYMKKKAKNEA